MCYWNSMCMCGQLILDQSKCLASLKMSEEALSYRESQKSKKGLIYGSAPIQGNLEIDTEDTNLACDDDSDGLSSVCKKCYPVLSHYQQTFQGLVEQGSELKKCKQKSLL